MTEKDDFLAQLEDYLDNAEGSTPLPNAVRDTIRAELPSTRQIGPPRGLMRIFAMTTRLPSSSRYALAVVVVGAALVGGATFILGSNSSTPSPSPTPSASTAPTTSALVDRLIAAWNAGDSQQVTRLYGPTPIVRFMINSSDIASFTSPADIAAQVAIWHGQNAVLTRTGNVLTQGPYAACTVTWTSSQGTFNGALVVHVATGDLVSAQYLIGATPTVAPGSADGTAVVTALRAAMTTPVKPIVLRLGAATPDLFALNALGWQWEGDGTGGQMPFIGRNGIAPATTVNQPADSQVYGLETQGAFVVYSATAGDQGFNVLWLTSDGLIQYTWDIRVQMPAATPTASGG